MSENKRATQSTTVLSSTGDFIASKAVDRDITTCMRTNPIGTTSPKTMWWKVDLGGVYSIYSVNIKFKNYKEYGIILSITCKIINILLILYENLR